MGDEMLQKLKQAVLAYDRQGAIDWARKIVEASVDPLRALDALTEAIREVGEGFGKGELFLPDMVGAADAMKAATPILEAAIERSGAKRESVGTVVLGTVFGDIHDIGKAMVSTLMTAQGFKVVDLGVNITAEQFLAAVRENHPAIVAMSSLLTTTAPEMKKVIEQLKSEGLREKLKVMVGGGAITDAFAAGIGADGYDPTAVGGAVLARRLAGK
ncbi:MAG: cobalamin-dependent protein [bacterium]